MPKIGKNKVQKTRLFYRDLRIGDDIPKPARYRNGFGSRVVRYQYGIEPLSLQKAIGVFVKFGKKHFFSANFGVEELDLRARTRSGREIGRVNGHFSGL